MEILQNTPSIYLYKKSDQREPCNCESFLKNVQLLLLINFENKLCVLEGGLKLIESRVWKECNLGIFIYY